MGGEFPGEFQSRSNKMLLESIVPIFGQEGKQLYTIFQLVNS
jgi:hypothetical protein